MIDFRLGRHALGVCAAFAILAGCRGQAQIAPVATSSVHVATSSGDCPALAGGTGILPDGDFSQAVDPPTFGYDDKRGIVFAPDWEVSKRTIDFMGTTSWNGDGVDGYCSIDLDGYQPGGIQSGTFSTKRGESYTLSFLFSGNGGNPPTVKSVRIAVDGQFTVYTWDSANGYDIQNGDYTSESWKFKATGRFATLTFVSQDPKNSASGPIVAAITITKK